MERAHGRSLDMQATGGGETKNLGVQIPEF